MQKKVVVIGAGFAGIATACYLAQSGLDVTVIEKNSMPGGRARQFTFDGFTFDMGPSWYWMPDVFEKFFNNFGKKTSDYYDLIRLDPSYKVVFGENDLLEIPADYCKLKDLFNSIEQGSGEKLDQFIHQAEYKYNVGIKNLVYKPGRSVSEFLSLSLVLDLIRLDIFQSFYTHVRKYFKNEKLIQLLEFPILFLGAIAENTPALYSLMNFADIKLGTWYPKGGMYKIVEAMVSLATQLGVKFRYNEPVLKFSYFHKKINKIITAKSEYYADIVVGGADYHHIEQNLLIEGYRNYSEHYWGKKVLAPSSLIFYLGLDTKVHGLLHHTLFFDRPFHRHAKEIYTQPVWPKDPLFYVSAPSKTDQSVAPKGMENLFALIPVAPGLKDDNETREYYYNLVINRLEPLLGQPISNHIIFKKSYAHNDFSNDYNAYKGNAYGLANTLYQTALLKPSLKNKKLNNLYYTGQLTVPGPGVPPSLISGQVVAKEIFKDFKLG